MRTRTTRETVIICAAVVLAIVTLSVTYLVAGSETASLVWIVFFGIIGLGVAMCFQYFIAKKRAQVEIAGGEQYRQLAEEYRRLADMALTTQEHTDIKLGDVSAQLEHLREQMASLQNILKDVE
ncbi:MAG TPA: hypothetical protein VF070_25035 [Streptosporangiaceae bacterium]